jgi:hypothetical protein
MKRNFLFFVIILFTSPLIAQVSLPVTLNFTTNAAVAWADGIVQDGDGGSSKINGLDIYIFAADATNFNVFPGSIMKWDNNVYYASGDSTYNALTPGPDVTVTNNGVPAMVIKSANSANNFSLKSIELYDWGGSFWTIKTYDNGVLVGSINITFDQVNWNPKTITQAGELIPSYFQNIDEVRIIPNEASAIWPSLNKILLDNTVSPLPVSLYNFTAQYQKENKVLLKWNTASEQQNAFFILERSNDGKIFDSVATIKGSGTTARTCLYQYLDNTSAITAHTIYYRLKQVDYDGHFHFSKVITFNHQEALLRITIYPNPASEGIKVNIPTAEVNLTLKIYDMKGQVLWSRKYEHSLDITPINVSSLASGLYKLVIEKNNGQKTGLSFIKE